MAAADDKTEYDVKKIPHALLADADAIVRTQVITFEVKNKKESALKMKRAVTIFKREKRDYGFISIPYDKFSEINDLDGAIYDADGKKIRGLEKSDIKDFGSFEGYSIVSDARIRMAELYDDHYPYTVEFTYEIEFNANLQWPSWMSQMSLDAVVHSRFEVILPKEESLRYWCSNDSAKPVIAHDVSRDGSKKIYIWEARNLPKLSKDIVGDDEEDFSTIVHIAPSLFEIDNYPGDMRTWSGFGKWWYSLIKERDKLPESAQKDVQSILQPSDSVRAKIIKLYRYMQKRTRFISIQLGIGGWQPFDAAFVHEHGYGDCKALANYLIALLKAAGITAYPVLIRPGDYRYPFIESFPSNQFSHVVVCVPLQKDSVWLECTDSSIPAGHLSSSTEQRGALIVTPEGGFVVHTPCSVPEQNLQSREATVELAPLGSAKSRSITRSSGDQQDDIRHAIDEAAPQEREQWILKTLDIPTANLKNYTIEGIENRSMTISVSLELDLPRFASRSGERIFFKPNLMERRTYVPPALERRLSPIRHSYPYQDKDSIVYIIPSGYALESLPAEIHLKTSFGSFDSKTAISGDSLVVYTRCVRIQEYTVPAGNYSEYRKFWSNVANADRAQVILIRKP
jgi:hypothetical protein